MGRPPEARLIRERRLRLDLSIREAARRAGFSEGSWRRTEGTRDLTRTPDTVARMAQVIGLSPAELEAAGRPDAAAVLTRLPPLAMPDADAPVTRQELRALLDRVEELSRLLPPPPPEQTRRDEDEDQPRRRAHG
jgi:transcriptional regulator with XRE-family HTH domain